MSALLIALNVAILLYIIHSKIHIAVPYKSHMIEVLFGFYCATFICGVALWVYIFLQNIPEGFEGGIMGASHVMAIVLIINADLNPQQSISIITRSEQLYRRFSRVTFERRHAGQSNNAEASRRKKAAEISGSRETMEQEKETSRRNMQRSGVIAKRNEEDQGRFKRDEFK
ncbi:unnamed protein product [Brassica oleracea]|uniref:(rape) hypothetical protein n=1 Tax=Brassica napus TaxID=3708 RepID=A0A816US07_BRANA|nr:unnamed protein product [Brassica napus]